MLAIYLLMGLTFFVTNTVILAAIKAPDFHQKTPWWSWVLWAVGYVALWPVVLGVWVFRIFRPFPDMDVRRIPKEKK